MHPPVDEENLYDLRLIRRYTRRGWLSAESLKSYLEDLPDVSDRAEFVAVDSGLSAGSHRLRTKRFKS